MGRASQALAVAALLLLAAAASPASALALAAIIGLPVETKDVQGQPVPLPSDAVRKAANLQNGTQGEPVPLPSDAARKAASLPNGTQAEPVPLPGDAEKRAATGQPPAGPFGDPPPPPAPPADRQAERDRQLQAILAGALAAANMKGSHKTHICHCLTNLHHRCCAAPALVAQA